MDTMRPVLIAVTLVLLIFAAWLFWQNRGSGKVFESLLSTLIAAVAVSVISVLLTLKSENVESQFAAGFRVHSETNAPLEETYSGQLKGLKLPGLGNRAAFVLDHFRAAADSGCAIPEKREELYHEILTLLLLEHLFVLHSGGWQIKTARFDTPMGDYVEYGSVKTDEGAVTRFGWREVCGRYRHGDLFRAAPVFVHPTDRISLPPGSTIKVEEGGAFKSITIANSFVTLRIRTSASMGVRGLGLYRLVLGYSEEEDRDYWTLVYIVRVDAKFNTWKSGHPDMPKYKRWVDVLVAQLLENFSFEHEMALMRDYMIMFPEQMKRKLEGNVQN